MTNFLVRFYLGNVVLFGLVILGLISCRNSNLNPGDGREGVVITPVFFTFRTATASTSSVIKLSNYEPNPIVISEIYSTDPGFSIPFITTPDTLKPNGVKIGELQLDYEAFDGADTAIVVVKYRENPVADSSVIRILGPSKIIHRRVLENTFEEIPIQFNADASKILFTSNREGGVQVFTVDRLSKQVDKVNTVVSNFEVMGYTPDFSEIIYFSRHDSSTTSYVYKVSDGTESILVSNFGDSKPVAVSADGRFVLLNRKIGLIHHIYLLDRQTSDIQPVLRSEFDDQAVLFEPGDQRILLYRLENGMRQIYKIRTDGSDLRKISDGAGDDVPVAATSDRAYILFYSDRIGRREVYLTDWDGISIQQITDNLRLDNPVDISQNYKRILYRSIVNGNPQVYEAGFAGENEFTYTAPDQFANEPVRYSSDGRFILYYKKMMNAQLFYVDLTTVRR